MAARNEPGPGGPLVGAPPRRRGGEAAPGRRARGAGTPAAQANGRGATRPSRVDGGAEAQTPEEAPLNEMAYQRIRAAIRDGVIGRRDPLSEDRLARRLGISRTPVREAIKRLAVEGLVEVFPRRGTFVSVPDAGQLREIFQVREALEGMAARLAAVRVPREAVDRFRARLDAGHRTGDAEAVFRVGQELHEWLVEQSGNGRLAGYLGTLRSQIQAGFSLGVRLQGQMARSYREYRTLLGALRRRDATGAERAMRQHIAGVGTRLLGG